VKRFAILFLFATSLFAQQPPKIEDTIVVTASDVPEPVA